jgi:hypothetical protein
MNKDIDTRVMEELMIIDKALSPTLDKVPSVLRLHFGFYLALFIAQKHPEWVAAFMSQSRAPIPGFDLDKFVNSIPINNFEESDG